MVLTYCILVLLLGIIISAIPVLRSKHHNCFEIIYRFLGWTATLSVWCQVRLQTDNLDIVGGIANPGNIVNERL